MAPPRSNYALVPVARAAGASRAGALLGAATLGGATAFVAASLSLEVYAFDACLLVVALGAAQRVRRDTLGWLAFGVACGLLVGHRPSNLVTLAPALALLAESRRRAERAPGSVWRAAAVGAAMTSAVYLYLPLACGPQAALCVGEPTTLARFIDVVTAAPYWRHVASGSADLALERLWGFVVGLPGEVGLGVALGLAGLVVLARAGRGALAAALAWVLVASVGFAVRYNILDVRAYFLPAYVALALGAAAATSALARRPVRLAVEALALAAALALATQHVRHESLAHDDLVDAWAADALGHAPDHAVLLAYGDTPHHALLYGQAVRGWGVGRDVAVVAGATDADWYVEQTKRRYPDLPLAAQDAGERISAFAAASGRPLLLTAPLEIAASSSARLGDLLSTYRAVPWGPLFRVLPADRPVAIDEVVAACATLRARALAAPAGDDDAQVQSMVLAGAMSRFALAALLIEHDRAAEARGDLEAIAAAGLDALEQRLVDAYATIGARRPRLRLGARSERVLARMRAGGASRDELLSLFGG